MAKNGVQMGSEDMSKLNTTTVSADALRYWTTTMGEELKSETSPLGDLRSLSFRFYISGADVDQVTKMMGISASGSFSYLDFIQRYKTVYYSLYGSELPDGTISNNSPLDFEHAVQPSGSNAKAPTVNKQADAGAPSAPAVRTLAPTSSPAPKDRFEGLRSLISVTSKTNRNKQGDLNSPERKRSVDNTAKITSQIAAGHRKTVMMPGL